ncbi:methyltransferase regulatory domain-containing protein [Dyella tabacisoli]|uniref:Methyltransferase domain-containing protein n=1 Tax=Dyella tabacisoli TaxID=2282381 RepID=A0A369UKM4_9GAMM|nr:methyltransferase regulatory domain-containing protein [Dyella tabacisoli]RDD81322.1 methyltransferase domain-containing protein [Dyella tabacisoli]
MVTMVEQISKAYDDLPYTSSAFPQSTPEHLRATAHLFGLDAPPLEHARVLELGCAAGGNIIPFAIRHPGAKVVGVDLSQVQIKAGQRAIQAMGLDNIHLIHSSINDLDKNFGQFDYIICHGVYSWVPEEVREAILRVSQACLSPEGLAYISYNVYPGWKAKEIVRDAMLLRGGTRDNPAEKLAYARGMIDFLHDMAREGSVLKKVMDENIEIIRHGHPNYLVHEFLELCNAPCYFRDFVAAAGRHGLSYLAEADIASMFASNYHPSAAQPLLRECDNSQQTLEQLLDFLTNRTFRQTLLVHTARAADIRYRIDNERIRNFHIGGRFSSPENPHESWHSEHGVTIDAPTEIVQKIMRSLTAAWPSTMPVSVLVSEVGANEHEVLNFIQRLIIASAIRFRLDRVSVPKQTSEHPLVPEPLRRLGLFQGSERPPISLFNLWHETIAQLGVVEQTLLPLLDGQRDINELSAAIHLSAKQNELNFLREGQRIVDPDELIRTADEHTRKALQWLHTHALLSA